MKSRILILPIMALAALWAFGDVSVSTRIAAVLLGILLSIAAYEPALAFGYWMEALLVLGVVFAFLGPGYLILGLIIVTPWIFKAGATWWQNIRNEILGVDS